MMLENMTVYISSRNNYEMLRDEVLQDKQLANCNFINIDDNSSDEQIALGRDICKAHNVLFVKNEGRGLFMAAKTAVKFAQHINPKTKFVYWLSHDCSPITQNLYEKLDKIVATGALDQFGCVGLNTIWKKYTMSKSEFVSQNLEGRYCGVLGRAVLTNVPGAGWYRPSDIKLDWSIWGKNIAVECVTDMNLMINVELFNKCITVDDAFHHFCWGDDMCLQFLKANHHNVTLSNFYVYHDQDIKTKYKIPVNSYRAASQGDTFHFCQHDRHYDHWKKKWGFDRNWHTTKQPLDIDVIKSYEGTLLHNFMTHDYTRGPLITFDLGGI